MIGWNFYWEQSNGMTLGCKSALNRDNTVLTTSSGSRKRDSTYYSLEVRSPQHRDTPTSCAIQCFILFAYNASQWVFTFLQFSHHCFWKLLNILPVYVGHQSVGYQFQLDLSSYCCLVRRRTFLHFSDDFLQGFQDLLNISPMLVYNCNAHMPVKPPGYCQFNP